MKQLLWLSFFVSFIITAHEAFEWTVVGAGPAGIIAVGVLLDAGVDQSQIAWIDPEFNVGWLGSYCKNVPANVQSKMFIDFLASCESFQRCESLPLANLFTLDPDREYPLGSIIEPLQDITTYFKTLVPAFSDCLIGLDNKDDYWYVTTTSKTLLSKNVILATGSHPRVLNYACETSIPLQTAIDKDKLAQCISREDTIAVVGSAHSAILILKYLSELPAGRIINFYKKPLVYPVNMGDWELNAGNGLKGDTARWAQQVLEVRPPINLLRLYNNQEARDAWLPICTKIIYACGFERNNLPPFNDNHQLYAEYDASSGIIAPRLFGLGIAFPEVYEDSSGNMQTAIGLPDFMEFIQEQLPIWMKKKMSNRYNYFNDLFVIKHL